jgi:hypothetical protein
VKVTLLCMVFFAASALHMESQADDVARKEAVTIAKDELARTLRASAATIELVEVVARRWRDSALGCPEKGVVYAPVLTSGYIVRLRVGKESHAVHVGSGRAIVCAARRASGAPDANRNSASTMTGLKRADEARAALATTLSVPITEIVVDFFRPASWPDSRLGCDKVPAPPAKPGSPISGFLIQLSHRGQTYLYHSDEAGPPRLCAG